MDVEAVLPVVVWQHPPATLPLPPRGVSVIWPLSRIAVTMGHLLHPARSEYQILHGIFKASCDMFQQLSAPVYMSHFGFLQHSSCTQRPNSAPENVPLHSRGSCIFDQGLCNLSRQRVSLMHSQSAYLPADIECG